MTDLPPTDLHLAAALRGAPPDPSPLAVERALYHGIGPLLYARSGAAAFRDEARARAMWELRHRLVLSGLLAALAAAEVRAVVMKGTALAYDLYPEPALRPRGDTDLLVAPADLDRARAALRERGFAPFYEGDAAPDAGRTQEIWQYDAPDGSTHEIDLHWQAFNAVSLAGVIPVAEALAGAVPLLRLGPGALGLSRPLGLIHACVHRAQHIVSPYFVEGEAHYGGDRLIWLCDIDLLARALTPAEWDLLLARAAARGVAPVCHAALEAAGRLLATPLPAEAMARLAAAPGGAATGFLLQGRRGRVWADLRSGGWRRGLYRLFPPGEYIRMKYPASRLPLPLLYLRRIGGFLIGRRP